ncbi:MAG: hypothetical protein OEV88_04215 [Gammaproteobacteria bacterium]|jgi:hypothetical protein|nr:hypothetical protein [Gammaproteobacteria bacterium]
MRRKRLLPLFSALYLVSLAAPGQEPDITLHSTVSGNREQPKVMYILPWQQAAAMEIEQDFNTRLEGDLFEPLDRDEFIRELNYQATINPAPIEGAD